MPNNTAEQYLLKAAAAETIADKFADGYQRQAWLDIADGYRELAKTVSGQRDCAPLENDKSPM
jgi:hypothetical protein